MAASSPQIGRRSFRRWPPVDEPATPLLYLLAHAHRDGRFATPRKGPRHQFAQLGHLFFFRSLRINCDAMPGFENLWVPGLTMTPDPTYTAAEDSLRELLPLN